MGRQRSKITEQGFRKYVDSRVRSGMADIFGQLNLPIPDMQDVYEKRKIKVAEVSFDDNRIRGDVGRMLKCTAGFDLRNADRDYPLTGMAWEMLLAAKERGRDGVVATLSVMEGMTDPPEMFDLNLKRGYQAFKHRRGGG